MCNSVEQPVENMPLLSRFLKIIIFLIFVSAIYLVVSFKPLTKEDQIKSFEQMDEQIEPFRKNLSECARQVKATPKDVQNFLKRIPQSTMQGKCFVACILKRNALLTKNRVNSERLLEANKHIYGEDSDVMHRLVKVLGECKLMVDNIFEVCEYASVFNDCMNVKMEHTLDKETLERRMEALGQISGEPDDVNEDEDDILQLLKDEL